MSQKLKAESQKSKVESRKANVFFVPTVDECKQIFPDISLAEWQYGILHGRVNGTDIFISGMSKTNTAFSAAHIFNAFDIESACLIGIAGAYRQSNLKPGDVVCVTQDTFVDEGMLVDGQLSMTSEMGFPVCPDNQVTFKPILGMPSVIANTVSWLSSDDTLAAQYCQKTDAAIESMEGAAFGLAAAKMNIPCYQIRGISNYCGARDTQEWNIKAAFKALKKEIVSLD